MSRLMKGLVPAVAILAAGYLAAGCAQGDNIRKAAASSSAGASATASPATFSPGTGSPRPTREPATRQPVATPSAAAPAPAAPSASPAAPSASPEAPSQAAAENGSGSSLVWLWILLGVLVVAGAAVLIARRSGRRSATAASWHSRAADAGAKGSALYDMMSMAGFPDAMAAGEASMRWADIQRRADDLTQELYALRDTAPGDIERARVVDVLAALQAVRSAMNAEHAPGSAGAPQDARVHSRLASFEAALHALRSPRESPY